MLYEKNKKPYLDSELFKNPTSEYRGTPFWAWNCELTKEELERQISILKEMGFGGFHMHSRTGMATEYLSDKFFDFIKFSTEKAKENGFDYFATTLTVSPLKNACLINEIGVELEGSVGIKYLPTDFKKDNGYLRSITLSKENNLYRQNYCGCEFSKER